MFNLVNIIPLPYRILIIAMTLFVSHAYVYTLASKHVINRINAEKTQELANQLKEVDLINKKALVKYKLLEEDKQKEVIKYRTIREIVKEQVIIEKEKNCKVEKKTLEVLNEALTN